MPELRPFRALRFNATATDLSSVLAPPYDIISPTQRMDLLAQDPYNAVRLDLPADVGQAGPDDYRSAAETLRAWRRDGVLVIDQEPTLTVHQMSWTDADGQSRTATGFFVRVGLEEFGPGAGVLPHERTLSGPKQDRYDLLQATELNTSPLVLLAGADSGTTAALLGRLMSRPADVQTTGSDGVAHRLWIWPGNDEVVEQLLRLVATVPMTIADGHHRYETALTYRRDRRAAEPKAVDAAWDYVMALVYPIDQAPPALPTHRVVRGGPSGGALWQAVTDFVDIEPVEDKATLLARMGALVRFSPGASGTGRLGCFSGGQAAILTVRQAQVSALLDEGLSAASRGLDVNALTAIIEQVYGDDPDTLVSQGRLAYVKDAAEAVRQVTDADACFLLDPMPASAISSVAESGEVMPQKSTYFHPKAPTGLVFSPLEW